MHGTVFLNTVYMTECVDVNSFCMCDWPCKMDLSAQIMVSYFHHTHNWRAPWKNRKSSTSMKLRKSLVKPVMWQNISSYSVLSPEIVLHDAFNVILWTSADICIVMHDNLGWKNLITRYILPRHWLLSDFCPPQTSTDICVGHDDLGWKKRTTCCNRFWRAGCSRLEYIDIRLVYRPNLTNNILKH